VTPRLGLRLFFWSVCLGQPLLAGVHYGDVPVTFEPNLGQSAAEVRFLAGSIPGAALKDREIAIPARGGPHLRLRFVGGLKPQSVEGLDPTGGKGNYFIGEPSNWYTDVPQYQRVRYRRVYPGIDIIFRSANEGMEFDFVLAPGANPSRILLEFSGA